MNERPILFSGPMVRAILNGRKTQTRRILDMRGLGFLGAGATGADWNDPACWGRAVEDFWEVLAQGHHETRPQGLVSKRSPYGCSTVSYPCPSMHPLAHMR